MSSQLSRVFDTADVDELRATITAADGTIFGEVDGNTANQPLVRRFEEAGFADFFYAPVAAERRELRKNKLPDFDSRLTARPPLDTLYTLLADADFDTFQDEKDAMIAERRGG